MRSSFCFLIEWNAFYGARSVDYIRSMLTYHALYLLHIFEYNLFLFSTLGPVIEPSQASVTQSKAF